MGEKGKVQIHQDESLVSPRPPLRKEVVGSEDWLASGVPNRSTMQGGGPSGRWPHKAAPSGLSAARQLVGASSRRQTWFMKIRARRCPQQIGHLSSHVSRGIFFCRDSCILTSRINPRTHKWLGVPSPLSTVAVCSNILHTSGIYFRASLGTPVDQRLQWCKTAESETNP